MKEIRRALLSVSDKTGLVPFAKGLANRGVELVASAGTAAALQEAGLAVTSVQDVTGAPEMLGGRVKTLHPSIHGAILARRDDPEDSEDLRSRGIRPIDLVVVNLYPFARLALRRGVSEQELIDHIDIGGPAMLRAAAKNHASVAVISSPDRYGFVLDELRANGGALSPDTRRELAAEAFAHSASYEIAIANWFAEGDSFPERLFAEFQRELALPYGENPHQRAAYYSERGARRHAVSMVHQHAGRPLSFNNIADLSFGRELLREFSLPGCVIVKHKIPCGVALAGSVHEAYQKALAGDPVSAYGGVVTLNRAVTRELAEVLAEQFIEVLFAPGYEDGAIEVLRGRQNLRILENRERRRANPGERGLHRVMGGILVQDLDSESEDREMMTVATSRTPSEREWGDLIFAWRVAKHVRSNAIVLARDLQTIGIGAGQMSRVDAVRIAVDKALVPVAGSTLASDAFFPFPDGPQLALDAGVVSLIQPGGAKRDDEVVAAAERAGALMVLTGRRHFSH